jgi:hypothetical protein
MNPPSERRFPRFPLTKAKARPRPGARFLRAKGPVPYQPKATPWVTRPTRPSPEGATQPVRRRPMDRPRESRLARRREAGWIECIL